MPMTEPVPETSSILIVAATRAEAAHAPPHLPVVITGIGKTTAAIAVTRALAAHPDPSGVRVLNIGTAGALRDGVAGLHLPGVVLNHDVNAEAIRSLGYDPRERLDVDGDPTVTLASGDVFVADPLVRERLAETAQLVDMEGYAVALAAASFGARVTLVKHVSDNADETAWEWPDVVAASAVVLGEWLRAHVD
ncbi:nucleosidase [Nocardioides sp. R-C-SC26]|uniref:nucleosidase n=1 Tax=Nocardioides sp. R-C-SC26 TaxID=2870414 RepID=UPI001E400FEE|nr:nucleosidase [Nocardioides sp. R-C-SC26]